MEDKVEEKSLYICCRQDSLVESRYLWLYSVQAISLSELFTYLETPVKLSLSRSPTSKPRPLSQTHNSSILREVGASLKGDERMVKREVRERYNRVPFGMGCGVFGTQILLAGGIHYPGSSGRSSADVYIMDTNLSKLPKQQRFRFIKADESMKSQSRGRASSLVDILDPNPKLPKQQRLLTGESMKFQSSKRLPKLMVIEGKLYALDLLPRSFKSNQFQIFDTKTWSWASLPELPAQLMDYRLALSCSVVGTKILVSQSPHTMGGTICRVYCFDVADHDPKKMLWKPILPCYDRDYSASRLTEHLNLKYHPKLPIVDGESLISTDDGELVMTFSWPDILSGSIRFLHIDRNLTEEQKLVMEYVATIEIKPKFNFDVASPKFIDLGGRKVCCVLMGFSKLGGFVPGVFFTFEYSFSKEKTTTAPSPAWTCTNDPYFSIFYPSNSNGTSFSAKTLGWIPFEYWWDKGIDCPDEVHVLGLAVLPLHQQEHAQDVSSCGSEVTGDNTLSDTDYDLGSEGSSSEEEEATSNCNMLMF